MGKSPIYSAWTKKAIRSKVQEIKPGIKGRALKEAVEIAIEAFPGNYLDDEVHQAIEAALDEHGV